MSRTNGTNIVRLLRLNFQQQCTDPSAYPIGLETDAYDWFHYDEDPEDLFSAAESHRNRVSALLRAPLEPTQEVKIEEHLIHTLARLVYGSNLIEKASSSWDVTLKACTEILSSHTLEQPNDQDCDEDTHSRSYYETTQHCHALSHILYQILILDKPLTEDLILSTHKILTYKVDSADGDSYTSYGGVYRRHAIGTPFAFFTPPQLVPAEMRNMLRALNSDLQTAKGLDPYALAAKYCHEFVNIHPFADGNGRMCRLILNALLFKYAGVFVVLGETEELRREYLALAARGSQKQQGCEAEEQQALEPPWGELAYVVLVGAKNEFKGLLEAVE